jgi:hypothetical protein
MNYEFEWTALNWLLRTNTLAYFSCLVRDAYESFKATTPRLPPSILDEIHLRNPGYKDYKDFWDRK